jgi:hypothetical protein
MELSGQLHAWGVGLRADLGAMEEGMAGMELQFPGHPARSLPNHYTD